MEPKEHELKEEHNHLPHMDQGCRSRSRVPDADFDVDFLLMHVMILVCLAHGLLKWTPLHTLYDDKKSHELLLMLACSPGNEGLDAS